MLDAILTAALIQSFLHAAPLAKQSVYPQEDTGLSLQTPYFPYGTVCMINTACVYTEHSPCNQCVLTHTATDRWDNILLISEERLGAIPCFVVFNDVRSLVILIK